MLTAISACLRGNILRYGSRRIHQGRLTCWRPGYSSAIPGRCGCSSHFGELELEFGGWQPPPASMDAAHQRDDTM